MEKTVQVVNVRTVKVNIPDGFLSPDFMKEFRDSFYPFTEEDDHYKYIAQMFARDLIRRDFVEGYGDSDETGIRVELVDEDVSTEVLS